MPGAVIRATRTEVSDRFPLLGFTVKTGAQPFFETVIMTSPELAANANKTQRTPETFWSSRSIGPLSTERGEAVFMVPDDVLRRFAGKQRLYYAVATFADRARTNPDVSRVDAASMPYVKLSPNFSRRRARQIVGSRSEHRRWNGKNGGGYGEVGPALEWAGDEATPGSEAATPLVGDAPDAPATGAGPATTAGVAVAYDDGFDGALWRGQPAGPDAPALGKPAVDVEWPGVMAIPETNGVSSWIAAAASIAAWLAGRAGQLGDLAARAGNLLKSGSIDSANLAAFAQAWDLIPASGTALGVQQFRDLLAGMGPLWIAAAGSPHAVVVSGLVGDGTSEGTRVRIKDPWTASSGAAGAYELSFTQFVNTFSTSGDAATAGMHVLHLKEGLVQSRAPGAPGLAAPALAQARSSLAGRRGNGAPVAARAAAAPVIVPIVSTIVGASLTRVMNNEGDVKWELDQMNGLKHPGDDVARGTAAAFVTAPVLRVEGWPKVETGLTDQIYADFEVRWQHNGHSLGNIAVSPLHTNDAWLWGLQVKETITNDATVYAGDIAAVRILFHYTFTRSAGPDAIAVREFRLYGNGVVEEIDSRWLQKPEGWTSTEQSVQPAARAYGGVAGAIAGAVAGPIVNTLLRWVEAAAASDITYKFPELDGWKHVNDDPANRVAGAERVQTAKIVGPAKVNGTAMRLNLLVTWSYDGRSVGDVRVRPADPSDAVGWGLHVDVTPFDDRGTYQVPGAAGCAAIRLLCTYKFSAPFYLDDDMKNMDVLLYGDGTHAVVRH